MNESTLHHHHHRFLHTKCVVISRWENKVMIWFQLNFTSVVISKNNLETVYICAGYIYVCIASAQAVREREIGEEHLPALISCRELTGFDYTTSIHTHTISHRESERRRRNRAKVRPPAGTVFACFFFRNRTPGALSLWIVDSRLRIRRAAEIQ